MQICANTMIYLEEDALSSVTKLAAMGFRAVDVFCDTPTLDYRRVSYAEIKAIRDIADRYQIELSMHGPCWDLNAASASPSHREDVVAHYRESIRLAGAIGAKTMVVHSGWRSDPRVSRVDALRYAADTMARCLSEAEQTGVVLAVENVGFGTFNMFCSPDDWVGIVQSIGSPYLGLALDFGHAFLQGLDLVESVTAAGSLLRHVHLHSNDGITDAHWRLDQGVVDISKAVRVMQQNGFSGHASLEIYAAHDKEEALIASRKYFLSLLAA